jgi:hypothetical protein
LLAGARPASFHLITLTPLMKRPKIRGANQERLFRHRRTLAWKIADFAKVFAIVGNPKDSTVWEADKFVTTKTCNKEATFWKRFGDLHFTPPFGPL